MSISKQAYDFNGKVVIITGASSGFGEEMARLLASYGASLTITGRNVEALGRVAKECEKYHGKKVNQVIGDLVEEKVVKHVFASTIDAFGKLDVLINNAGGTKVHPLATAGEPGSVEKLMESYDYTFNLNVRCTLQLTAMAVPYLEKTKGTIINISAVASYVPIGDPWFTYSMSKGAVDMLTKNAAVALGKKGITVNSINPGPFRTNLHRDFVPNIPTEQVKEAFEKFSEVTFVGRIGDPKEVAHLAAFLASDAARYITGSLYTIDGGCGLMMPLNMSQK